MTQPPMLVMPHSARVFPPSTGWSVTGSAGGGDVVGCGMQSGPVHTGATASPGGMGNTCAGGAGAEGDGGVGAGAGWAVTGEPVTCVEALAAGAPPGNKIRLSASAGTTVRRIRRVSPRRERHSAGVGVLGEGGQPMTRCPPGPVAR
ncbi:MAG TPA: hypothetical protein VK784_17545 [Pseudonocardiaceae bacterium]|nr:hypothetical protein [Pseudonocardiaceae bacterium]